MKEPKHTRGPWMIYTAGLDWGMPRSHSIVPVSEDQPYLEENVVAEVYSVTPYVAGASRAEKELARRAWANANLIAAAPEMYDLLEEIARGPYEDSDCRSLCEAYAARARALLDKARGVHEAAE